MLPPFRLLEPTSVAEAATELGRLGEDAEVYAGGAELLLLMRNGLLQPGWLVNVKGIGAINVIAADDGAVRIGATVSHHRLERDPLVCERLPLLALAESQVANPRVRAQGTLGGNLCFADPHSDPPTALLVHEAAVTVSGKDDNRILPLDQFLVGPYQTALQPDELLCWVEVPPLPPGWGHAFGRIERFHRPTVNVGVAASIEGGRVAAARLVVGCVGPKALRLAEVEKKLLGLHLEEAKRAIASSSGYLKDLLQPVEDLLGSAEYKLHVTAVLLARALAQAASMSNGQA